jgi:hypothetical protein
MKWKETDCVSFIFFPSSHLFLLWTRTYNKGFIWTLICGRRYLTSFEPSPRAGFRWRRRTLAFCTTRFGKTLLCLCRTASRWRETSLATPICRDGACCACGSLRIPILAEFGIRFWRVFFVFDWNFAFLFRVLRFYSISLLAVFFFFIVICLIFFDSVPNLFLS